MSRPLLHTLRCAILAGLAGLVLGVSAQERFDAQVDTLLRLGHDRPDVAMAALRCTGAPRRRQGCAEAVAAGAGHRAGAKRPRCRGPRLGWRVAHACAQPSRRPGRSGGRAGEGTQCAQCRPAGRGRRPGARRARCPAALLPAPQRAGGQRHAQYRGCRTGCPARDGGALRSPHRLAGPVDPAAPCRRHGRLDRRHPACQAGTRPGGGGRGRPAAGLEHCRAGLAQRAQR